MKRFLLLTILPIVVCALLAGGWIFQTRQTVEPTYSGTVAGDANVSVRFEVGTAEEAAARTAEAYRSAGTTAGLESKPTAASAASATGGRSTAGSGGTAPGGYEQTQAPDPSAESAGTAEDSSAAAESVLPAEESISPQPAQKTGLPGWILPAAGAVLAAAVGGAAVWYYRRKKKQRKGERVS